MASASTMATNKAYSSFSQTKGLMYWPWFDGILANDFLPPVGVGIDVTNACNLQCQWCNARAFRSPAMVDATAIKGTIDDLAAWGVKSVCFAGGGEPTLHPDFPGIVRHAARAGMEVGVSTNGTRLAGPVSATIIENCRFCGVSVDAGTSRTWNETKGPFPFQDIIRNLHDLVRGARGSDLDITYKMVIAPANMYEIYDACRLAKAIGVSNFFVRPVAFENIPGQCDEYDFDHEAIETQLAWCRDMETPTFGVYGNFGRVDSRYRCVHKFDECRATPLFGMLCADGYAYLCIDYRGRPYGRLCRHDELREFWNSPAHHAAIAAIDRENCPRCTFGHYNEQIDHYRRDTFFRWFP